MSVHCTLKIMTVHKALGLNPHTKDNDSTQGPRVQSPTSKYN